MKIEEKVVYQYLLDKGVKPHLLGFTYLKDAIMLIFKNQEYQHNITTMLYPEIAKYEKTTASKVERAIRHSLFNAKLKYSNAHFIALACIEISTNNK